MSPKALLCLLVAFICSTSISAQEHVVSIPGVGVLRGKEMRTMGNLDNPQKTYYGFRNLPFGHLVSDENRFKQATRYSNLLGSAGSPYDAVTTGPYCQQGGSTQAGLDSFNARQLTNWVETDITNRLPANASDVPGLRDAVTDSVILMYEDLFDTDLTGVTVGQFYHDFLDIVQTVSEECLHLAVYTPVLPGLESIPSAKLPVMVFIHGGGYFVGDQYGFDASRLGDVADVVVVAIHYRLGSLGFMNLGTDEAAGNMAMLDQILALQWVRDNIAPFGGDPDKVTIVGQSAGGSSVGHLILSPAAQGLFWQAIGESGAAVSPWAFDETPEVHCRNIAAKLGCVGGTPDEIVACLRTRQPHEISIAQVGYYYEERARGEHGFGGITPCAQTNGAIKLYEVGHVPEDMLNQGDYTKLPIMFGANSHEGTYIFGEAMNHYLKPNNLVEDADFLRHDMVPTFLSAVGVTQPFVFQDLVQRHHYEDWQMGDMGDMMPGNIDWMGMLLLKASCYETVVKNSRFAPSFYYSVEHTTEKKSMFHYIFRSSVDFIDEPGVSHADELMYLFYLKYPWILCDVDKFSAAIMNTLLSEECDMNPACVADPEGAFQKEWHQCLLGELTPEEQVWSDRMVKVWTNFAIHGNPTPDGATADLPLFPAWSRDSQKYMAFRKEGAVIADDYTLTYNQIMKESITTTTTTTTTTAPGPMTTTAGASRYNLALPAYVIVVVIFAVLC